MKKIILATLICFTTIFSGCEKTEEELLQQCFKAKILDEICGTAVLQIQDPAYYQFGIDGYQLDGVTYDHVFSTELSCADLGSLQTNNTLLRGREINIKILKQAQYDPACIRCASLVLNAPAKWIPIKLSNECK